MRAAIGIVMLAACASAGNPTKVAQMTSAGKIDTGAAFATALAMVQEQYPIADVSLERGMFATRPQPLTDGEPVSVSYVVWFEANNTCSVVYPVTSNPTRCRRYQMSAGGRLSVLVTPVAFSGNEMLPPDRVPMAARHTADDLARAIHVREQEQHVIY